MVGGLERRLAQGLPGLALAVPLEARQGLVAVQGRAYGLPQAGGGAGRTRGTLVLTLRCGDPGQRLQAVGIAHLPVEAFPQPQALLLQAGGPVEVTPAPGRHPQRIQGPRRVPAADVFAVGLGQRGNLPVAGDGALFVTGQARGVGQPGQQEGAHPAADGGGQDRQPDFVLGDGLVRRLRSSRGD